MTSSKATTSSPESRLNERNHLLLVYKEDLRQLEGAVQDIDNLIHHPSGESSADDFAALLPGLHKRITDLNALIPVLENERNRLRQTGATR